MNPEVKARWLEALRSGRYRQTTGELRNSIEDIQSHCCLGVLCDLVDPNGWDEFDAHHNHEAEPCTEVLDDAAVENGDVKALIAMNDDDGLTFAQIADWIEANL